MQGPDDVELDRRIVQELGLYGFLLIAWPHIAPSVPYVDGWHIQEMCIHAQGVSCGAVPALVCNVPPGTGKSLIISVAWPAFAWIERPWLRWIFASYGDSVVAGNARKLYELVNSAWFQARWPSVKTLDRSEKDFRVEGGGSLYATTVRGQITGKVHAHIRVVDDPIKPIDAQGTSAITRNEIDFVNKYFWDGTMATRIANPKLPSYCVVMQRLHEDDLSGHVLATDPSVVHLRLPMRYEAENPCITPFGGDHRTYDGELLCPNRYDETAVKRLEAQLNIYADAQLQQRPSREGGQIIRESWLKYFRELPPEQEIIEWLLSWDMTFKDTAGSDYVCGQVWCRTMADFYLVDRFYERANFPSTVTAFEAQSRAYPQAVSKLVEDKANGPAVIATLEGKLVGLIAVTPKGGKIARLNAVSGLHRAGNVHYWDPTLPGKAWVREHVKDITGFPFRRNDDTVDAESQALAHFTEFANPLLAAL